MTEIARKIFCLGLGCQKGGTTWLHRFLNAHPRAELGGHKEHHLFDNLFLAPVGRPHRRTEARLADLLSGKTEKDSEAQHARAVAWQQTRLSFFDDPQAYARYFQDLAQPVDLTGDITPAYALLEAEHLSYARTLLEGAGFAVRPVFIMRDPVRRAFSALQMNRRNDKAPHLEGADPAESFRLHMNAPRAAWKSQYDRTLTALDGAFERRDIGCYFYEELFSPEPDEAACARNDLCAHLGLAPLDDGDPGRINAAPLRTDLPPEIEMEARRAYEAVYAYCRNRFGAERIDRIWPAPAGG